MLDLNHPFMADRPEAPSDEALCIITETVKLAHEVEISEMESSDIEVSLQETCSEICRLDTYSTGVVVILANFE